MPWKPLCQIQPAFSFLPPTSVVFHLPLVAVSLKPRLYAPPLSETWARDKIKHRDKFQLTKYLTNWKLIIKHSTLNKMDSQHKTKYMITVNKMASVLSKITIQSVCSKEYNYLQISVQFWPTYVISGQWLKQGFLLKTTVYLDCRATYGTGYYQRKPKLCCIKLLHVS
jgi:hypothetical protein